MCCTLCGMIHIKEPMLLIEKSSPCGSRSFLFRYLSGPLPYVRRHITVNKNVLSALLNKPFPSFVDSLGVQFTRVTPVYDKI